MSESSSVDRLSALPSLADVPREQLGWLVEHGEFLRFDDGTRFYREYEDLDGLFILLVGRFSVRVGREAEEREVREVTEGQISGFLPYSRITTPRGFLVADGSVELLLIPSQEVREMTRECYDFTALCVHAMLDRVRRFKGLDKEQEKMAALGRLSAGMAHGLNNPASAVARAARELDRSREVLAVTAAELGTLGLGARAWEVLKDLEAAAVRKPNAPRSALEQSDAEDRFVEWLDRMGVGSELADVLAGTGVNIGDLDEAAAVLDEAQLPVALRFLAASASTRTLTADIGSAAEQIHSLVAAVSMHTHMDRADAVESIRVEEHLADTIELMSSKARRRGVSLRLTVEPALPAVAGRIAELNQVWLQLVDNAIDAAPDPGTVSIEAHRHEGGVMVQVVDDGPGIPKEDAERVFEPFFTGKDVGEGSGLGLDIVRAVVLDHKGTVSVDSEPGRTEFRVVLPISESTPRDQLGLTTGD